MIVLYDVELHGAVVAREVTSAGLDRIGKDCGNVGAIATPLAGPDRRQLELRPDGMWWFIGPPPPFIHIHERP